MVVWNVGYSWIVLTTLTPSVLGLAHRTTKSSFGCRRDRITNVHWTELCRTCAVGVVQTSPRLNPMLRAYSSVLERRESIELLF